MEHSDQFEVHESKSVELQLAEVDIDGEEAERVEQLVALPGMPFRRTEDAIYQFFRPGDLTFIVAAQGSVLAQGDIVERCVVGGLWASQLRYQIKDDGPNAGVSLLDSEDVVATIEPPKRPKKGAIVPGVLHVEGIGRDPRVPNSVELSDWMLRRLIDKVDSQKFHTIAVKTSAEDDGGPYHQFVRRYGLHLREVDEDSYWWDVSMQDLITRFPPEWDENEGVVDVSVVHACDRAEHRRIKQYECHPIVPSNLRLLLRDTRLNVHELLAIEEFGLFLDGDEELLEEILVGKDDDVILAAEGTLPSLPHFRHQRADGSWKIQPSGHWKARRTVAAVVGSLETPNAGEWQSKRVLDIDGYFVDEMCDVEHITEWLIAEIKRLRKKLKFDVLTALVHPKDRGAINFYWRHGFTHRKHAILDMMVWDPTPSKYPKKPQ